MSRFRCTYRRRAGGLVVALVLGLAAACGSGATEGPDGDGGDDRDGAATDDANGDGSGSGGDGGENGSGGDGGNGGGNGDGGGNGGNGGEEYSWGLPGGDLTVDDVGQVFNTLRRGDCAGAEAALEGLAEFRSPTQRRLYRAAIAACSGDVDAAREILGDGGITSHPGDCRLYRAIQSVVDRRSPSSVECPAPEERPPDTGDTTSTETVEPTTESTTETTDPTDPTGTTDTTDPTDPGGSTLPADGEQDGTG